MNIHVVMCHIIQFRMTVYWYASVLYIKHSFKLIVISVDMIDPAVVYHCWETGWEYWRNQSLYKRSHKTRSFGNANFYWIVRVWWSYETVRMSRTKFLTGTKSFKGAAKSDRPVTLRQSRANVSKVGEMIESDGNDSWCCQSCWHIAIVGAFNFEAYFESAKDFCQRDTPYIDGWPKNGYEYKPLSYC